MIILKGFLIGLLKNNSVSSITRPFVLICAGCDGITMPVYRLGIRFVCNAHLIQVLAKNGKPQNKA